MKPIIAFDPVKHKYTYVGNDPKYKDIAFLSTTTFIGKFKNEFEAFYWSYYKAIKDYCCAISQDNWQGVKKRAGGWHRVYYYYIEKIDIIPTNQLLDIERRATAYREQWTKLGDIAKVKGTGVHEDLEGDFLNAQKFEKDNLIFTVKEKNFFYELKTIEGTESYPECIIYNLQHGLSGMVDRVERDGIYLDISDYKTNVKIETEAFMDQKMKVLGLPDCSWWHYTLQMSIYGWMLEQFGYKVRSLTLEHVITESRESREVKEIIPYKVEYRPDLVEKMLEYRYKEVA